MAQQKAPHPGPYSCKSLTTRRGDRRQSAKPATRAEGDVWESSGRVYSICASKVQLKPRTRGCIFRLRFMENGCSTTCRCAPAEMKLQPRELQVLGLRLLSSPEALPERAQPGPCQHLAPPWASNRLV